MENGYAEMFDGDLTQSETSGRVGLEGETIIEMETIRRLMDQPGDKKPVMVAMQQPRYGLEVEIKDNKRLGVKCAY